MSLNDMTVALMSCCVITYNHAVGRWEPDAAGRLRVAALDLFQTVGYEETTVAQIAERAGVTARTFFRYFADKPEVLFAGSEHLQDLMAAALAGAAADASPLEAMGAALDAAANMLGERADYARQRHQVISAHPALAERELMKLGRLTATLAGGLRDRGVDDPRASLTAEAGVAAFRVGFASWVAHPRKASLQATLRANLDMIGSLAAQGKTGN